MATYENLRSQKPNVFEYNANTAQTSTAVSNEIYGALILEPTIPSTVPVCEKYEDLDDFWLDLAKGQTLKQTKIHPSSVSLQQKHDQTDLFSSDENSQVSAPRKNSLKYGSSPKESFVVDTSWEYSPGIRSTSGSNNNNNTEFFSNDNNDILVSNVVQQTLNSKLTDIPLTPITDVDDGYELASSLNATEDGQQISCCHGNENYISMDTNTYLLACNSDDVSSESNRPSRRYTMDGTYEYAVAPAASIYEDNFITKSLNRGTNQASIVPSSLGASTQYESVDDLSGRAQMPLPESSRLNWVEITGTNGFSSSAMNDEPIYAQVIKKNTVNMIGNDRIEDAFDSLASERLREQTTDTSANDRGLGLNYTYAKVIKPKRYMNWPMSESIRKANQSKNAVACQNPDTVEYQNANIMAGQNPDVPDLSPDLIYEDISDVTSLEHYHSIKDVENEHNRTLQQHFSMGDNSENKSMLDDVASAQIDDKGKITLKSKWKGLLTAVKSKMPSSNMAAATERSSFYPFSFIFNFQIKTNGQDNSPIKSILPHLDGKCWVICENDLKIRLYDSQGLQTESIHIGLQGEDMAYDNSGYLYITCTNTKRIFRIDTRNLCTLSKFVDSIFFPSGLAFDCLDNTLIVCQNQQSSGVSVGVAPIECLQKYSTGNPSQKCNVTSEQLFSHPCRVRKNANTDIIVSDTETNSIAIMKNNGQLKSIFTGNDVFKINSGHSFVCDLQSNILVLSQDKQAKGGKSCDNVCLLDESGDFIDTFYIEEIKDKIIHAMAITDLGFLWIGGEHGILIFDYQIY